MGNVLPCVSFLQDSQSQARIQEFRGALKHICDEDGTLKVVGLESEEQVVKCMAVSFAGTKTSEPDLEVSWALGPEFADFDDPRRLEMFRFCMKVCGTMHWVNMQPCGVALGIDDAEGGFGSIILARLYPRGLKADSKFLESQRALAGLMARKNFRDSMPSVWMDKSQKKVKDDIEARLGGPEGLETVAHHEHGTHAPGPHIYVAIMAVHPDAQGKGYCGKSMRAISRVADALQVPCYLETGSERNAKIYGRFGYEVSVRRTLRAPNSEDFPDFFVMVRPPSGAPKSTAA